ncbi:CPBP family intramembrane glutamic endopeptidase [Streptosporangium roseum]|uniref:Protease, CAAX amino terminal family n=1 Tax=Streptosporangium roseum (strain ATCC 12428 / DSM 43021 / JCM 3005 / KCTC 9067 / NCIMB 10171 / NRRL 2505 / NI 9100) TaxID=479432 RepID=D2B3D3_STRRD|nr:CPBP family intramembrane glutamic endopeptidase [Streptosporangium roseum]ACZ87449.1 protease, CAAX amino terminal family [Streptosporangium roseum DSM 43021]
MSFTPLTLVLAVVLVGYLAVASPLLGKRTYDKLARTRDQDPTAYRRMFTLWSAELWALAAAALLIVTVEPGLDAADIGLVIKEVPSEILGTIVGFLVAATVGVLVLRWLAARGKPVPGQQAVHHLLPRTTAERWYAAGLSVTAGITEEIVYRGLLIAVGMGALGLSKEVAAVGALAVFVAGHLYQGWRGMLVVTLLGAGLTSLYLRTGSLLLPILLHALIDLRGLVFVPRPRRAVVEHAC